MQNIIENKTARIKKAITDGSNLNGLYYNEDILDMAANFVNKNYPSIEPKDLFKLMEDYATKGIVSNQKLSGAFLSNLINPTLKKLWK